MPDPLFNEPNPDVVTPNRTPTTRNDENFILYEYTIYEKRKKIIEFLFSIDKYCASH